MTYGYGDSSQGKTDTMIGSRGLVTYGYGDRSQGKIGERKGETEI